MPTIKLTFRIISGWGGGTRTPECRDQNPVPYHLATPQCVCNRGYYIANYIRRQLGKTPRETPAGRFAGSSLRAGRVLRSTSEQDSTEPTPLDLGPSAVVANDLHARRPEAVAVCPVALARIQDDELA